MSLVPTQLGAEPKKLAVLGALAVVLIVVYFINRTPDVPQQAATTAPAVRNPVPLESLGPRTRPPSTAALTPAPPQGGAPTRRGEAAIQDFKPSLKLPDGVEMVMPGDNVAVEVELITPIAMEKTIRFAIREGGKTVGAGRVSEILD